MKDIYKCFLCEHEIHTEQRDPGETPKLLACTQTDCFGVAAKRYLKVENDQEPEVTFIKPRDKKEWAMVRREIEKEIREEFPNKRKAKVIKTTDTMMFQMSHVIAHGGLCPILSIVVKVNK